MTSHLQPFKNTDEWARKIPGRVADQLIRQGAITVLVTVAGNNQVIRQGAGHALHVFNQGMIAPADPTFILAAHALAATAGQKQDAAVLQIRRAVSGGHVQQYLLKSAGFRWLWRHAVRIGSVS